jgi:hypothetical protein
MAGVLLAALGVMGWNMYVANLGGATRHPEIHAGWTGETAAGAGLEAAGASNGESRPEASQGEHGEENEAEEGAE